MDNLNDNHNSPAWQPRTEDDYAVLAVRSLVFDICTQNGGGHGGSAIGMAAIGVALWKHVMRYNPADPEWLDRDRFVLSNGHASMFLYTMNHLVGYDAWTMDELKGYGGAKENGEHTLRLTINLSTSYGLEFPKEVGIHPPLREDCPRFPEPYRSKIFYYTYAYDLLPELSRGKPWTFTEVRPDGLVGFAPGSNAMNMGQGIGIYLSIYREVNGAGATVPIPGSLHGYNSTHSDTFQDILSKMEIYAAVHPELCGDGRAFNVADGDVVTWAKVWPSLCAHFGLVGTSPQEGSVPMEDFVKQNDATWRALAEKHGLKAAVVKEQNWGHVHFMLVQFDFDRQYDLSALKAVGLTEEVKTVNGYVMAWERMRAARILPPL